MTCPNCDGTGTRIVEKLTATASVMTQCERCEGTGRVPNPQDTKEGE
jgi:DnaJ-class molecular chaperone